MQNPIQYTDADSINSLPVNQIQPSHNELKIVNTLFEQHGKSINKIVSEAKGAVLVGVLFILFSLTQIDDLVMRIIPMASTSPYTLLFIKSGLMMSVYWLIKNFWLSRQ
jgi:hypothetical protein